VSTQGGDTNQAEILEKKRTEDDAADSEEAGCGTGDYQNDVVHEFHVITRNAAQTQRPSVS